MYSNLTTHYLLRLFGRLIVLLSLMFFAHLGARAQSVTNYAFAASSGTFTALSSPSTTTWTGDSDDGYSALIPIGFDFWYMGARYTNVAASTNGWLSLGTAPTDAVYTNNLSSGGSPRPIIAPLWDDLNVVSTANVTYKTTGTAPSRVFTVQYLNVKWSYLASGAVSSFQARFYETTGKVEFVYRSDATAANSPSASIGITAASTGTGNFLSVNNAGTSVSSSSEANVTTKPASGKTYGFTPPVPTAPGSLTFTNVASTSMTLNWTDLSSNERGFVIYRSTDGTNYSFVTQTAANTTSSAQTSLTASTTYYWRVYAVSEGGFSSALSGSQATTCVPIAISQIPTSNLVLQYKFSGNANDASGNNNNGTLQNSPTLVADRFGITNSAYSFNGTSQYVSSTTSYAYPHNFTVSIWFKTTTTTGGKLIGFGLSQTGSSSQYDRHLYMTSSGQIYFGIYPGGVQTINTTSSYNDGNWHLATATMSTTTGMALYMDGVQVATNPSILSAEVYTGYWRIGYDNNNGWTNQPSTFYFSGTLDDALVYHRALSAGEVATLYNSPDGAGSNAPVCSGTSLNLTVTSVGGASYSWSGPNGFTSSSQNPTLTYTTAYAGTYGVTVSSGGCSATAYANVTSSNSGGLWTGNVSADWATAGNWCSGAVPTSSTDVVITSSATRMPTISTSVSCKNLTINSGATVTTSSAGTLNIAGTLVNSGTMTNDGTTNFNGTSGQQSFSGVTDFYNLTLSNSNGLLLPNAITVHNNLLLSAGVLTANNFNITVKGNWTNNVSATAFTAGTATVTFGGTAAQAIGGSASTTFNNLTIANTGNTVSLNVNASITGSLSVSSGTFDLGTYTANRAAAGGALSVSNSATLKIGGTNSFPTNYTTNTLVVNSNVEYAGTNQTVANQTYGNLILSSSSGTAVKTFPGTALAIVGNLTSNVGAGTSVSFTAAANITVSGNVTIGASTTFNGSSYSHSIGGNWSNAGTFTGSTSTVTFTGVGTTVGGAGTQNFNNLTVAASGVSFLNSSITLSGNLATSGSGSFSQASGGTLTMTGAGKTIIGSGISLDNLTVSGTASTATSLTLTGNLSVSGTFTSSAGTITMNGASKAISGAGTKSFFGLSVSGSITTAVNFSVSSSLVVSGSLSASAGTATFTSTSTLSGTANLYNVTINGTSLQLSSASVLGVANALTVTIGTLNVISSVPNTVNFNGTGAQSVNAITYDNLIVSNGNTKTASAGLTINRDITVGNSTTFNPSSYTHSVYGSFINNGTFTAGTSTVQFLGPAAAYIQGNPTTFHILTSNTSSSSTPLILLTNVSASIVNMTKGTIVAEEDTLTITNTRTGPGEIHGNIRRTHAFASGVSYEFRTPFNTINFTSVSSVTSVIVSIHDENVSNFPFGGSINTVYDINIPAGSYDATLRLAYGDDELNGNNESTMVLWNYDGLSWTSVGKSNNSTTDNWVAQDGLTNLNYRWTCSDNSNVVQWNGSVSTDWNTAANWTVVQGAASRPPSASDIANLGTGAFTNQPNISTAATAKNIVFGSVQAVTLSLSGGGSLTTGNIQGIWSVDAAHTINVNAQTLTANGDIFLSDGISGHAINLNIGAGTVNAGDLNESGGANITFTGAGTLAIAQDFYHTSGTFTAGSGTVVYNGAENQHVAHIDYNHLTIDKSDGIATIDSITNIGGNLLISAGKLDVTSRASITGDVTINSGAYFYCSDMIHVGGNWSNNGTYSDVGAHTKFDGSGTQTISASNFYNLVILKPVGSTAIVQGDLVIDGDLMITSGTFDIDTFDCNRSAPGGNIIIDSLATVIVGGNNPPTNFTAGLVHDSSTVIADGYGTQFIFGESYGNLIFRNSGTKVLISPFTVNGNLVIESGATLNGSDQTLTLNGNWIDQGTFVPSTGTVICAGDTKTITGNTTFNNMTVTGGYEILNNVTFNTLLHITSSGSLTGGNMIHTTMNGDLINSGVLYTLGTTTYTGNVVQHLSLINAIQTVALTVNFNGTVSPVLNSTSAPEFGYLNINNTGGINPSVDWTILYTLTVSAGASFNGGPSTHHIYGSLTNNGTITSSGTLKFVPATAKTINMGSNFTSTGRVVFGGAGQMTLAGTPISLHDVLISNTNGAGITPSSNWIVTNNFNVNSGSVFNAGSYSHSIGGNIQNEGTLNSNTSTITLSGTGDQDIYNPSEFSNLTLNKASGTAVLFSNATVNNVLNFITGNIRTDSYVLTQPSTGTVIGAAQNTGWVNGKLEKYIATGAPVQAFEVGDASSYAPVGVAFSNVTTPGNLTVNTAAGDHSSLSNSSVNSQKNVNRYWTLTNNSIVYNKYSANFNYATADIDAGADVSAFGVESYNGFVWTVHDTAAPTATSLQATSVRTFGDFVIGEMCNSNTIISYPDFSYCSNAGTALVTQAGTSGGAYTSTTGLLLDATSGDIDLENSTPGEYVVTYTVDAAGGCPVYITKAEVVVTTAPSAAIEYTGNPYPYNGGAATVIQTGTPGGFYSSTAGLFIDSITGEVTLDSSVIGTYTVIYSVDSGGCVANATADIIILPDGIWTGGASTDWHTPENWTNQVIPTTAIDVLIPPVVNQPIISDSAFSKSITIELNSTLMTLPGGVFTTAGDITNDGAMENLGTVSFAGAARQTFTGVSIFNHLQLDNPDSLVLGSSITVNGNLMITSSSVLDANDYDISLYGNWENNGDFIAGNGDVIFLGSTMMGGNSVTTFRNLIINEPDGAELSQSLVISNTLDLNEGALRLNSNSITLLNSSPSAIIRNQGYIISEETDNSGKLIWNIGTTTGSYVFPFGVEAGTYIPFTFDLTSGNIGNVSVSTYPTDRNNLPYPSTPVQVTHVNNSTGVDNSHDIVDRFWQIDKDGPSGTVTMTFSARYSEVHGLHTLRMKRWNSNTQGWDIPLPGQTTTATTVTVPDVTTFSPWMMQGSSGAGLPIELLSFTATVNEGRVGLHWKTATETNNAYFVVEKTTDGINYIPVDTVQGAGNSTATLEYKSYDNSPYTGTSYYRIKQTDFDGSYTYSSVEAVNVSVESGRIDVFPNPVVGGKLYVRGYCETKEMLQLTLCDITGRIVFTSSLNCEGTGIEEICLSDDVKPGIYLLKVTGAHAKAAVMNIMIGK